MIHLYRLNGFNIVIDINSGSIHVVDDLAYKIISLYKEEEKDINGKLMGEFPDITSKDIKETIKDIEELKREGKLFSKDFFENMAPMMKKKQGVLKAICL
ncbi:MAG: thioether cross-link-forming SCIFF peptide maturase, partial [Lachnospirales bacterium]